MFLKILLLPLLQLMPQLLVPLLLLLLHALLPLLLLLQHLPPKSPNLFLQPKYFRLLVAARV